MRLDVGGSSVYAYTGTRPLERSQPTVVFVHGAANDHAVFAMQSRYFAWHGRNVLAVDLPGHGRSGGAALPSVEAIAGWLRDLLDAAGVAEAAVVGHSMGALAALEFAARNADRVRRLALLGPSVPMVVNDALLAAAARDDHVAFELINGWSLSVTAQLGGSELPGLWMAGNAMRLMERSGPGVLAADLAACNGYVNGLAAAAAVRCPALVVAAARDLMAPLRSTTALIATLQDVRTVTLPDTGHAMMAERPGALLDALLPFA